jgi:nucleotide-binding universal stress UspA family protein
MSRYLVAYDSSPNARDALALARTLAQRDGATVELAHVHRSHRPRPGGERSNRERERFLARRATELMREAGGDDMPLHAVASTTTARGLRELAERERFDLIVFGSATGTAPGQVSPGSAARRLLHDGPAPLAFAPAGYAAAGQAEPVEVTSSASAAPGRVEVAAAAEREIRRARGPVLVQARG